MTDAHQANRLSLHGIARALHDCAPTIVLMIAGPGAALRCAEVIMRDDEAARAEFKTAEALAGYLFGLAKPQVARARQLLPAEQKALADAARLARVTPPPPPPPPPKPPRRPGASPATAPSSVALLTKGTRSDHGDIDALAEVLGCRVPLLRLPSSRAVLAEHGIEPQQGDGRDCWPLTVPNATRVRAALMHAAAAAGCWIGCESVAIGR